ncbi:MAG: circularly permuted type 2 ATP-grasp protein [Bacteriovoracaceae bacterium]|nr:circularly permuted type 2 ATP-grasp protein [Bacteriovoracaceae bacterium]
MKQTKKGQEKHYNPNLGFIGNSEVKVSNYLFSNQRLRKAYDHAKPITDRLMNEAISSHYTESKKLTKFLKNRDLTFSKKTSSGEYKTFTVPCTTTVVPLEKSLFNEIEVAAQKLMISLRGVIQDIYGSKDLESSKFIQSLPTHVRSIFIEAIQTSANYFPQLHHPNMKDYPFLDNVGLDLVLVEDYLQRSEEFPHLISKKKKEELPGLPFRILEINAGSPSGASNNMNVLEGIYAQNPEILDSLGKVMPNDHFEILGKTYKSLGESWTNKKNGVQILLPPGGQNGAAPEIHQLAAYSGLIYAEADQLYQDNEGNIRLRTVEKHNPIVTAIYSRVNADSALYDPDKNIFMKDPDSAEPLYLRDGLIKDEEGEGQIILDEKGKPLPQQSSYAIPGLVDAIINKKIYMGGLNRILDNKIILATLTHYAPKFFKQRIEKAGLKSFGAKILPPQTLPPTKESVDIILKNPDEWVVKAPSLAGGQGVYILKTMPKAQKEEILKEIQKKPQDYAYQQLVKIARIPVAVQRKAEGYKFANLAADIRTWVFFGGGKNAIPQMSHNALVRYAPQERGKMSSIVNTSAGGGYAPFVIVDNTNNPKSVLAKELIKPKQPLVFNTYMPVFVAAQMVQISRMLNESRRLLEEEKTYAFDLLNLIHELKKQVKEVLSYLHPRAIGDIYKILDILETRVSKTEKKEYENFILQNQLELVSLLRKYDNHKDIKEIRDILDNIRVLNIEKTQSTYTQEEKSLDLILVDDLISYTESLKDKDLKNEIFKLVKIIKSSVSKDTPNVLLGPITKKTILKHLKSFCAKSKKRLEGSPKLANFSELFQLNANVTKLRFETLYLGERDNDKEISVATQYEMRTGQSLIDDSFLADDLVRARQEWKQVLALANTITNEKKKKDFINQKRNEHFGKFPRLKHFQSIINKPNANKDELIELLEVVPYAKFNIESFAKSLNLSVKEVFTNRLKEDRISLLSSSQLKKHKLEHREFAGECFAKKKASHGLYSNSEIYIWIRKEINPFVMLYTAGHELIHYQQIKNSMKAEKRALKDGGLSIAKFLNYYGNFLGANNRSVDKIEFDLKINRKTLYGYSDHLYSHDKSDKPIISELDQAIRTSDQAWDQKLDEFGSLLNYIMNSDSGDKVKALQEVLPALENAKNILFAQELGLEINVNPVAAAMPSANANQVKYYEDDIIAACKTSDPIWESLRIIASHQYHGVNFSRGDNDRLSTTLMPRLRAVAMGSSYNQTQQ